MLKTMIDNIDVTGCKYALPAMQLRCTKPNLQINQWLCKENPNCAFKQLQRKKYGGNKNATF